MSASKVIVALGVIALVCAVVDGVRLQAPSLGGVLGPKREAVLGAKPNATPQPGFDKNGAFSGSVKLDGGAHGALLKKQEEDISLGYIKTNEYGPGKPYIPGVPSLTPTPVDKPQLESEGWVDESLHRGDDSSVPPETNFQKDASTEMGTQLMKDKRARADPALWVDDGLEINKPSDIVKIDPDNHLLGDKSSVDSSIPSQDDPVTQRGVRYSFGPDETKQKQILYPTKPSLVKHDPAMVGATTEQLAEAHQTIPLQHDIRVVTRGEDNDLIGGTNKFNEYTQGTHDSPETRSLDESIPATNMWNDATGAVDDVRRQDKGHFGAMERANLQPFEKPVEAEPATFERTPFREGMEEAGPPNKAWKNPRVIP